LKSPTRAASNAPQAAERYLKACRQSRRSRSRGAGTGSSSDESTRGENPFNAGSAVHGSDAVHGSGPGRPQPEERHHSKPALPRPALPQTTTARQPLEHQRGGPEEPLSRHSIEPQELFSDPEGLEEPGGSGMTGLSMLSSHCTDAEAAAEQSGPLDARRAGEQPYHLDSALNSPVASAQVDVRSPANEGGSEFASRPPQRASAASSDSGASSPRGAEMQPPPHGGAAGSASVAAGAAEAGAEEHEAEDETDGEEAAGDEELRHAADSDGGESSELDEELLARLGASGRTAQSLRRSSTGESSALPSDDDDDLDLPM